MNKKIFLAVSIIFSMLLFCAVYSADSNLDSILNNVESKYTQETFNDPQTNREITYNIYLPENYNPSKKYPLVVFIADSSLAGREATASLKQGYGGVIWTNDTQNECIILVPTYGEVIIDDMNGYVKTDYLNATKNLIDNVSSTYSVDTNRIYGTGQSMGGMTMLYLASTYPDLFAAELFVSCQWDINELDKLDSQKFIYIVSNGDEKASAGQKEVMEMLNSKNVKYGSLEDLDAQSGDNNDKVNEMLNKNNKINFISFKSGTVTTDSSDSPMGSSEHMASFDYAYKLDSLRNWLFKQHK